MTKIISALSDISSGYDAVLCDLWGCFHNGITPHASAITALQDYRKAGGLVALFTNAPRQASLVAAQLERMGAPKDCYDLIITSGQATLDAIEGGQFGGRFFYVGPEKDNAFREAVAGEQVPIDAADYILCSGLDDDLSETPDDFAELYAEGVKRGLPFLSANPDIIVDKGDQRLFCAGAVAAAYVERGGTAHAFGKPHAPIYKLAVEQLSGLAGKAVTKDRLLGIGDGPATDVAGALAFGIDSLFIAGGLGAEDTLASDGSIKEGPLNAYLKAHNAAPQYSLAFLV